MPGNQPRPHPAQGERRPQCRPLGEEHLYETENPYGRRHDCRRHRAHRNRPGSGHQLGRADGAPGHLRPLCPGRGRRVRHRPGAEGQRGGRPQRRERHQGVCGGHRPDRRPPGGEPGLQRQAWQQLHQLRPVHPHCPAGDAHDDRAGLQRGRQPDPDLCQLPARVPGADGHPLPRGGPEHRRPPQPPVHRRGADQEDGELGHRSPGAAAGSEPGEAGGHRPYLDLLLRL